MAQNKFKISLRENGEHSFARGIKAFEEYSRNHDGFLLKDAIIFSHHGIELLMKEILVKKSEYLIFEELKELPKKQIDADRQNIDIFSLERPPRTVSYDIALDRVQAFIKPAELDSTLRQSLDQLNRLRNQIEHYSIEIDRKEVEQILATIHEPLLKLFEAQIGKLSLLRSSNIDKAWNNIQRSVQDESVKILEVYDIVRKFKGQKVPGYLLNADEEITLPKFDNVVREYPLTVHEYRRIIDIWAESRIVSTDGSKITDIQWIIEVKATRSSKYVSDLDRLVNITSVVKATPWLIVFSKIPERVKREAKSQNILLTGADEWEKLKGSIESN